MKRLFRVFGVVGLVLWAASAFAQGGGASAGTINGRVTDASGGVLPGATVTAKSPSLMGAQTSVTDPAGNYRFPALPPGTYTLTYELQGFNSAERAGVRIAIDFTATVNVELTVAALEESVTVKGESPVIDTSSTRVQQTFALENLQQIPNARDMWSLLAVTPSVTMTRTDIGGSQVGSQGTYRSYGFSGQTQVVLEGINITYDASLSQLYPDYGALEEVSVGTISKSAEVAGPGVQTQMLTKSGGNRFQGDIYIDYLNNTMQSANIPDNIQALGILKNSNQADSNRNFSANLGGPIKRDKVWWYFSYHNQSTNTLLPNFVGPIAGTLYPSNLYNYGVKGTVQVDSKNKLTGYLSRNDKDQPYSLVSSSFLYDSVGETTDRWNDVLVYKGEWTSTLTNNLYAQVVAGAANLSSANISNTDTTAYYVVDSGRATYQNGERKRQYTPQRKQITGSLSYFKNAHGTHNVKFGGGIEPELRNDGYTQLASGNVQENLNSGRPVSVVLFAPTATMVQKSGSNDALTTKDRLFVGSAYATDQWAIGHATFNLGVRWDHYRAWSPVQEQLAYNFGPLQVPAASFPEQTYFIWNKVVPRLGLVYDLSGNGRTAVKVNYGLYTFDPGISLGGNANPNQLQKSVTYGWTDTKVCAGCIPGDGIYQPGEEGSQTANSLSNNIKIDPNLKQPTSAQATVYVEQQLSDGVAARGGFVYYTVDNQISTFQPFRPASAYTVPFTVADPGAPGTALTLYGIPNSQIANFPNTSVVMNTPNNGRYKTLEFSIDKRRSHNYSLSGSFGYTWIHDFPNAYPNTPNGPFDYDYRMYSAKANATYALPWSLQVSGVYRFQAGQNYARTLTVAAPASCACTFSAATGGVLGSSTVFATPNDAYSLDNVSVIDVRLEKSFHLAQLVKAKIFVDGFNLTNRYAAETISAATGSAFQKPTGILAPRTGRIGFNITW